jgi:glucose/arabinose dehydrogenase
MISHPRRLRRLASTLATLIIASATGANAQQNQPPQAIDPPVPALPVNMFALPDDLEVTLWAQSPLLRNPSNIDVDAQGRVWVTEAVNYRRLNGKDPDGDRVVILEDTKGAGVADKSTVFVQGPALLAPLGIAVIDNKIRPT